MSSMKLIAHHDVLQSVTSHRKNSPILAQKENSAFSLFSSEQAHFEILDETQISSDFQV
jgi:hypothetical protein